MDELFGDQLVPHALQDPEGAKAAEKQLDVEVLERVNSTV